MRQQYQAIPETAEQVGQVERAEDVHKDLDGWDEPGQHLPAKS